MSTEALRGPWRAVLADDLGYIVEDTEELDEEDQVDVSVRRGTAVPVDDKLPAFYQEGDVLFDHAGYWRFEDDPSVSMETRWEQAQAVAKWLNITDEMRAGGSSSGDTRHDQ